jgi:hypothetical protein
MARPRKISDATWESIESYYKSGQSLQELATRFGISKAHLSETLRSRGIELKKVGQPKSDNPHNSIEEVIQKLQARVNAGEITEQQMGKEYLKYINEYERRQNANFYKDNVTYGLNVGEVANYTPITPISVNGEIYDDMMNAIHDQLADKTIGKSEALKRYLHLEQEFDEFGREDFDAKYVKVYPELNSNR